MLIISVSHVCKVGVDFPYVPGILIGWLDGVLRIRARIALSNQPMKMLKEIHTAIVSCKDCWSLRWHFIVADTARRQTKKLFIQNLSRRIASVGGNLSVFTWSLLPD